MERKITSEEKFLYSHREFPSLVPLAQKCPNLVPQGNVQQLDNEWQRMAFIKLPFTHDGMAVDEYWGKMATITDGAEQQQTLSFYERTISTSTC